MAAGIVAASGVWPAIHHSPAPASSKMVDISVALVRRGDEILACYNDKRGAFALPMSKRREIKDPNAKDEAGRLEDGTDTAFRSAAGKNRLTGHSRSSTPHVRPAKHCPP